MKPYSFQEYEIINYQYSKSKFYKIIFLILIIGIIYILCNHKFNIYEKAILYKEDNKFYLLFDLSKEFKKDNNSYLKIDNKEYYYRINGDIKYTNINGTIYKNIPITIDKSKELDEYIQINYLYKSKTLINIIFELLGGGKYE